MYKTNKRLIIVSVIVLVAAIALGAVIATPKHGPTNNETLSGFAKGVSLSPKSFNSADFTDFFVKAKQAERLCLGQATGMS